jgi:DNA-binding beta-propeller fold protein YncE
MDVPELESDDAEGEGSGQAAASGLLTSGLDGEGEEPEAATAAGMGFEGLGLDRLTQMFAGILGRRRLGVLATGSLLALGLPADGGARKKRKKKKPTPCSPTVASEKKKKRKKKPPPKPCETPLAFEYVTAWGSRGTGDGQFEATGGAAVDGDGNVYVADYRNHRMQKFAPNAQTPRQYDFVTKWGEEGNGNGQFSFPSDPAVDADGNVYVADVGNNRIQKFTSGGTFLTKWGSLGGGDGQFRSPKGTAVDSAGNVYVADHGNHRVQKFAPNAQDPLQYDLVAKWGTEGDGDGEFKLPQSVALDAGGNIYVAEFSTYVGDRNNDRIQKFSGAGAFVTKWGSFGTGNGQFDFPAGVAVDADGHVFVADRMNNRIQVFTSSGAYLTQWGTPGDGDGEFQQPVGVTVDGDGNVYVSGHFNNRIQKFAPVHGAPRLRAAATHQHGGNRDRGRGRR